MSLPGLAALTLIGVSRSSLAYMAVSMLRAALDDGYCAEVFCHDAFLPGSRMSLVSGV
jgi:hypothetical protein